MITHEIVKLSGRWGPWMPWEGPQLSSSGAWMWPQAGEPRCELCTGMHFEKIIFRSVPQSKYFDFISNHFPGQWPSFFISNLGRGKAGEEADLTPLLLCPWMGHLGAIPGLFISSHSEGNPLLGLPGWNSAMGAEAGSQLEAASKIPGGKVFEARGSICYIIQRLQGD